ncbi:MAG: Methyltransferase type 11 [Parcubacteria group bacterium GW2011_GWA2_47_10]|nr:MAG: Methyltransferase type 11 [Parcubacteria group bacterium GW2011_GWA2_47_10]
MQATKLLPPLFFKRSNGLHAYAGLSRTPNLLMETSTKQPHDTISDGFLQPEKIVKQFSLPQGLYVADFGCGAGYFTIPVAKAVGKDGKVYAIDIQKTLLDTIRVKANLEHISNIETVWGDLESPNGSKLKDAQVDFVMVANILFQSQKKPEVLKEAARVLKPGGWLSVIEWDQSEFTAGPPVEMRVDPDTTKKFAASAGLEFKHEFIVGSHHYGMFFQKSLTV